MADAKDEGQEGKDLCENLTFSWQRMVVQSEKDDKVGLLGLL